MIFDAIYILTLQNKDISKQITHLKKDCGFQAENIHIYRSPKRIPKNSLNEGKLSDNLWNILNHSTKDEISLDIMKNHLDMISKAYSEKQKFVLFLEDDAFFPSSFQKKRFQTQMQYLKKNIMTWDIAYLGYCPWPWLFSFFITSSMIRLHSALTAHSYVLHFHSMEKIIQNIQLNPEKKLLHIDRFFSEWKELKKYAIFPMICFQEKDPALYVKACDHVGFYLPFSFTCRLLETISLCLPILFFVFLIIFVLLWIFYDKKKTKKKQ